MIHEPEIKKRKVQVVNISTSGAPSNKPEAEARTVTWHCISKWQQDNRYILSGYRPAQPDYLKIFTSLTFLHNETYNVYTHLVGALVLPLIATAFMRDLSEPRFLDVSGRDRFMFGIFFWCAECCLVFSATYHLLGSHSRDVEQFWHGMDLLGIVIVTIGTFIPGIHYIFICEPSLQKLHWAIVSPSEQPPFLNPPSYSMVCVPRYADMNPRS
jgi:adiponectin receptor